MTAAGSVIGPMDTSFTAIKLEVSKTVTKSAARINSSGDVRGRVAVTPSVYGQLRARR
jgi:hypothetical protein